MARLSLASVLGLALLGGMPGPALAQGTAPVNDMFADALQLPYDPIGTTNGTVEMATAEAGEQDHLAASGYQSVWYRWVAPRDGVVTFTVRGKAYTNTTIVESVVQTTNLYDHTGTVTTNIVATNEVYSSFTPLIAVYRGDAVQTLCYVAGNEPGRLVDEYTEDPLTGQSLLYPLSVTHYSPGRAAVWPESVTSGSLESLPQVPCGVTFPVQKDRIYQIAVDVDAMMLGTLNYQAGEFQLSWGYDYAGMFQFNADQYYCGDNDTAYLTVTRRFGSAGSVMVDYSIVNNTTNPAPVTMTTGSLLFENADISQTITLSVGASRGQGRQLIPGMVDGMQASDQTGPITTNAAVAPNTSSFQVVLSNPRFAPDELAVDQITAPEVSDAMGRSTVMVYPKAINPRLLSDGRAPVMTITNTIVDIDDNTNDVGISFFYNPAPTAGVINFARSRMTVSENTVRVQISLETSGSDTEAHLIYYTVDSLFGNRDNNSFLKNISFPLQAGSDYAVPDTQPEGVPPSRHTPNFTPVSGQYDSRSPQKYITINIQRDGVPNFSKDFVVQLYQTPPTGEWPADALTPGFNSTCYVTITDVDNPAGSADPSYNPDMTLGYGLLPSTGTDGRVYAIRQLDDGRTLLGGSFMGYNTAPAGNILRVKSDGTPDPTFIGRGDYSSEVRSMALDAGGRIYIGGSFSAYDNYPCGNIARLTSSGDWDSSFQVYPGAEGGRVYAVVLDPATGKVYVGGDFTTMQNTAMPGIARLLDNGTLDPTFVPPAMTGPVGGVPVVYALALAPGGGVYIGGDFAGIGAHPAQRSIARLLDDGSLDTSFNAGYGVGGEVRCITVMSGGGLMVGGNFNYLHDQPYHNLGRFLPNGAVDLNFSQFVGPDGPVYSVAETDEGIVIGGSFRSVNYTRRFGVARLFQDGTVDTTFLDTAYNPLAGVLVPTYGAQPEVRAVAVHSNGGILVGGVFSKVGQINGGYRPRDNYARLLGGATPGPGMVRLVDPQYRVSEKQSDLFIRMAREGGDLGQVGGIFAPQDNQPGGAGDAKSGVDYLYEGMDPVYLNWHSSQDERMLSYAFYATNDYAIFKSARTNTIVITDVPIYLYPIPDNLPLGDRQLNLQLTYPVGNEVFFLGGQSMPLGVALGSSAATKTKVTIADADRVVGVIGFKQPAYAFTEDTPVAQITLTRTNGTYSDLSFKYRTVEGGQANPPITNNIATTNNYVPSGGWKSLVFPAGTTQMVFSVQLKHYPVVQPDLALALELSSPSGAPLGLTNAVLTIIDTDLASGRLGFSSTNYSAGEDSGAVTVSVSRRGSASGSVTVDLLTTNGTAIAGTDYLPVRTNLVWNNGEFEPRTVSIRLNPNLLVEPDKTFGVYLQNPRINTVLDQRILESSITNAQVTILNDDAYGTLGFVVTNYFVKENGGYATIVVQRVSGYAETVNLTFKTLDGTAVAGVDYVATNGNLKFLPGEVSHIFTVPIIDNLLTDGNRQLDLELSLASMSPGTLDLNRSMLTIIDDETTPEPPGTLDPTFSTELNGDVYSVALQPDGRILAGGAFTLVNKVPRGRVVRLFADGALDTSFLGGTLSGADGTVRSVLCLNDSRILIGGSFTNFNGSRRPNLVRVSANGILDVSFTPGYGPDGPVYALAEVKAANGIRTLVGGQFLSFDGKSRRGLVQLDEYGKLDPAFKSMEINGVVYAIAAYPTNTIQAGKILIGGEFTMVNGTVRQGLARLMPDGTVDTQYDPCGTQTLQVRSLSIQDDGRLLVGGFFVLTNGSGLAFTNIARLNVDGSMDSEYLCAGGADQSVLGIARQLDQRIVPVGAFLRANSVTRHRVTRQLPDGSVDPTINFGSGADNFIAAVAVQTDGKLLVGGGFTNIQGKLATRLARLFGGSMTGCGSFEFNAARYYVSESGTNALVSIRRVGGTEGIATVDFMTMDGSAENGVNYIGMTNTIEFPVGETFLSAVIPVLDDSIINEDKTVNLAITNPTPAGAVVGNQPFATLYILDDDCTLSFTLTNYSCFENAPDQQGYVYVNRAGNMESTVSVDFSTTTNGTAKPDVDFAMVTNHLVFAPGESNKLVLIPITNNFIVDGDRTVELVLSNEFGAYLLDPKKAWLTIKDDDNAPGELNFASNNFTAYENSGNAVVTVSRTKGSKGIVSAYLSTLDGTAMAGRDYLATNQTLVFADGERSKTFNVRVFDNFAADGNRNLSLTLTNPLGGASIGATNSSVLTILDNEQGVRIASPAYIISEASVSVTIFVERMSLTNVVAEVGYRTTNITAVGGVHYLPVNGILHYEPGEVMKSFNVPILQNNTVEGDKTFAVALSDPSPGLQIIPPGMATVVVTDDDPGVAFGTNYFEVFEDCTNVVISVVRSNASTGPITVDFKTMDGTAVAGVDYVATNVTLSFADGEAMKTIRIPIIDNGLVETDEEFYAVLDNPSTGVQILPAQPATATIVIHDNDAGFLLSSAAYRVSEGAGLATITVLRTNYMSNLVSVAYATVDGTAHSGLDYIATNGVLDFTNNEVSKTFTLPILDDSLIQGDHTFVVRLLNPSASAQLLYPSNATVTIVDNDGGLIVPAGSLITSETNWNSVIDPNEPVTLLMGLRNAVGSPTTNLVATLQADSTITPLGTSSQTYGAMMPGGASASRPFSFRAAGTNGQSIKVNLQLADMVGGRSNYLGYAQFQYVMGTLTTTFMSPDAIVINDKTNARPYPSIINVTGLNGEIYKVTMTLSNLSHRNPQDICMLLVAPNNLNMVPMAGVGGLSNVVNTTITLDDDAASACPPYLVNGVFRPTNNKPSTQFTNPAPAKPYGATFATFQGILPIGNWSLYVLDDYMLGTGLVSNGWALSFSQRTAVPADLDLCVAIAASPEPVVVTSNINYSIAVTNNGPSPASGVVLTNILPAGAAFVSASSGGSTNAAGQVVWNFGTMARDARTNVTVTVRAQTVGIVTSVAMVSTTGREVYDGNNTASVTSTVIVRTSDLVLAQLVDSPDPIGVGAVLTYGITVSNLGPAMATGVMLTNWLPAGVQYRSSVPAALQPVVGGVVVIPLGNMPIGSMAGVQIQGSVVAAGLLTNIASVSMDPVIVDSLKGNNKAVVKTLAKTIVFGKLVSGNTLYLSWPDAGGVLVEGTVSLSPSHWAQVTNPPPVLSGGYWILPVNMQSTNQQYFRIRLQ